MSGATILVQGTGTETEKSFRFSLEPKESKLVCISTSYPVLGWTKKLIEHLQTLLQAHTPQGLPTLLLAIHCYY